MRYHLTVNVWWTVIKRESVSGFRLNDGWTSRNVTGKWTRNYVFGQNEINLKASTERAV